MKKYLYILTTICLFSIHTLQTQTTQEEKSYHLCQKIKKIKPNAPASEYKKLVKLLHDNDLSVCECAWNIVDEKRQKAFTVLRDKKFITDENIDTLNERMEQIKEDKEKQLYPLEVTIPENLPQEIIEEVVDYFSPSFSVKLKKYPIEKETFLLNFDSKPLLMKKPKSASTTTDFQKIIVDSRQNIEIQIKQFNIFLPENFKDESELSRKATFQHEEQHMFSDHCIEDDLLYDQIQKNKGDNDFPSNEFNKYSRVHEFEADIIPAACGETCECAQALANANFSHHVVKFDPYSENQPTHPTAQARQKLAKKISKLREQEELLKAKLG